MSLGAAAAATIYSVGHRYREGLDGVLRHLNRSSRIPNFLRAGSRPSSSPDTRIHASSLLAPASHHNSPSLGAHLLTCVAPSVSPFCNRPTPSRSNEVTSRLAIHVPLAASHPPRPQSPSTQTPRETFSDDPGVSTCSDRYFPVLLPLHYCSKSSWNRRRRWNRRICPGGPEGRVGSRRIC